MELNYLRNIIESLRSRFSQRNLPFSHELKREIIHLNEFEKRMIRNQIISMSWNINSINVISLLMETDVLSINEYLLNQDQDEIIQIITDILEDSNNNCNLIEEIISGNKFNEQIDECLKNYVHDVIVNPELIENELISGLEQKLSKASFAKILATFLDFLMNHQYEGDSTSLIEIVSNQKEWNEKFSKLTVLERILSHLAKNHGDDFVQKIMELMQGEKLEFNWFFMLMLINFIKEECDRYIDLKSKMKIF